MILQSVIFFDKICDKQEMFLRMSGNAYTDGKKVILTNGAEFSTNTYMNFFDSVFWREYTCVSTCRLTIQYKGIGSIEIGRFDEKGCHVAGRYNLDSNVPDKASYDIDLKENVGNIYFRCTSGQELVIYSACYSTEGDISCNTRLGIVFCTYNRLEDIKRNIDTILQSRFFDKQDELFEKIEIVVVDNGRTLTVPEHDHMDIIYNANTGGSGGFSRGIREMTKPEKNVTDILLMDDDVTFMNETLYRLYAFLSLRKQQYSNDVVAGRMFRKDRPWVQYTACEIWNGGDIKHIGHNCDMTVLENIIGVNKHKGEYSGWWMCCFPKEFLLKNAPLPFFLHCDDVELGLRHKGTPVILNGVQVWHETYEYRQNAVVAYYDMRNMLFVNEIVGCTCPETELKNWKEKISNAHVNKDYKLEYMLIKAMNDYLRGMKWLCSVRPDKYHVRISKRKLFVRYENALFWRFVYHKYKKKFGIKDLCYK